MKKILKFLASDEVFAAILFINVLVHCMTGNVEAAVGWFFALLILGMSVMDRKLEESQRELIALQQELIDEYAELVALLKDSHDTPNT